MALRTTDEEKSRIDEGYESGQGAYANAGIDQLEALANDPSEHKDLDAVRDGEESGTGWDTKVGERSSKDLDKPRLQKAITFAKKRGGIIGLISLFGIGGGLLAGFFGPSSMLINLTENLTISNDSTSTAMERRFMKIFGNMTGGDDANLCRNGTNIKCKMGRISNSALNKLSKKGIVAVTNGTDYDGKKTGYPDRNPTHYRIDGGDPIPANQLMSELAKKENRKVAAKVLGRGGAFNLRVKAWAGKYITNKFYNKFGISRNGGIADGTNKRATAQERLAQAKEKLKSRIPGAESASATANKIKGKIEKQTGKAKKGGVAYLIAVGGCISVKAPGYIAAGVAAVQLAQLLPVAMDVILSPGAKAKASGVDTENSITSEDMDTVGTLLTNKTQNEEGQMSSALDSPYLLAALGVNKSKPGVSTKFAPGYSILTSDFVTASQQAANASEEACNVIMSPTAMYTAMAADIAVTAAASATIIGGLIKIAASFVIGEIISALIAEIAGSVAEDLITDLAQNDAIPNAEGEELGDVLGISAAAFFSSGAMSRHLPTLTTSQLAAFSEIQKENEAFHREMDIASLSPFDISSRYTFLGNITYNAQMAMITNGGYTNPLSTLSSLIRLPTSDASASQNFSSEYCGYADNFRLDTEDGSSPAINMAGLPCTGITDVQNTMTSEEAINLLIEEGWLDDEKEISDGDTIDELMEKGIIKEDTLLREYIETCSNPDTGDYLFNAAGCTVPSTVGSGGGSCSEEVSIEDEDGNTNSQDICEGIQDDDDTTIDTESDVDGVENPRAIQAMATFLLDYQIAQTVNGEDEEVFSNTPGGSQENSGKINPEGWAYPMDSPKTLTTYGGHNGDDMAAPENSKVYSMRDGIVVATETMPVDQVASYCPVGINGPQNNLIIDSSVDGKTYRIRYAHLNSFNVSVGQMVRAGDLVGLSGNTGCSTGPHLHVDIQVDGVALQIFPRDIFGSGF